MSDCPLISVVTVSYQAENTIEKTIKSVLYQTYSNIEYIFKDGVSKDNTNNIIDKYEIALKDRGINTKHIISKDTGIYNAMNQSLKYCEGKYIIFLNADDEFYCDSTLKDIFDSTFQYGDADIIYGDADFVDPPLHFLWKGNMNIVKERCPFCHQSSFVKTQWIARHPFDETLYIVADYDFIYRSFIEKASFCYVDQIISKFNRGGVSGTRLVKNRWEHRTVQLRYNEKEERKMLRRLKFLLILLNAYAQEIFFKVVPLKVSAKIRHMNKKRKMSLIRREV